MKLKKNNCFILIIKEKTMSDDVNSYNENPIRKFMHEKGLTSATI